MNKSLLFILFIFTQTLTAQHITSVPEYISRNEFQKSQAEAVISHLKELNPLLIPFYYNYLHLRFEKNITSPDSNYFNTFNNLLHSYRIIRNRYAESEIRKAYNDISLSVEASKVSSYINDLITEEGNKLTDVSFKKENINYYFLYNELSGKNDPYDISTDYMVLSRSAINEKAEFIKSNYYDDADMNDKEELARDALKYWYLFKDSPILENENQSDISLNSYLDKIFHSYFHERFIIIPSISNLINLVPQKYSDDFWVINSATNPPAVETMQYLTKITSSIPVGLGINIPLREHKTLFSSLEFRFNYFIVITETEEVSNKYDVFFPVEPVRGTTWNAHKILEKNNLKKNLMSFELKTPVYFLYQNLFFSAGISYTMGNLSYNYITEPLYDYINPETNLYKIEKKHSWDYFNGFFAAEYDFMNYLRLGLRFDTRTGLTAGLSTLLGFRI